ETKSLEEQYNSLVKKGNDLMAQKSFSEAKNEFENALKIKPAEIYPKSKIGEIDKLLADISAQKALEEKYNGIIGDADAKFKANALDDAKVLYQSAMALKPAENYPKDQIKAIEAKLGDIAKQKATDDQYAAKIAESDKLLDSRNFDQAKLGYQAALLIKPGESYPKEKIASIESTLADLTKQKALDDQYKGMIQEADKLFQAKTYDLAKSQYSKALALKSTENYPKEQISKIETILAQEAETKSREEQYASLIKKGDGLMVQKSFAEAKGEYENALKLKPSESYPKTKIVEIDKLMADIAAQKALDEKYNGIIADADSKLKANSLNDSKILYQSASVLKPSENYPKDQIKAIDAKLDEIAKQKATDEQYAAKIGESDKLLEAKNYDLAKLGYQAALVIKPGEAYPKQKLGDIDKAVDEISKQKALDANYAGIVTNADKLLGQKLYDQAKSEYGKAGDLKPSETYPKTKIGEIEKILADIAHAKEVENLYKSAISKGDQLLVSKNYLPARNEYTRADSLKPGDIYAKGKLGEIDHILSDAKALDDQYKTSLEKADGLMDAKSYDLAKVEYNNALKLKPGEKGPKDKLAEIDVALAAIARQKTIDDQYRNSISKAEKLLSDKFYDLAKTEFGNALNLKPGEQYPKDKIAEIEAALAEIKTRDESYKASISKADGLLLQKLYDEARTEYETASTIKPLEQYPKTKINEINGIVIALKGKKQTFDDLVKNGDELFGKKDYYRSKEVFRQASGIFPEETYPKQRLSRITVIVDSIYKANKGLYDKAISDGDKYLNSLIYDKAIDSYTEAANYLSNEKYPREMINKIKKTIAENAIVDVLNTSVTIVSGDDKHLPFAPIQLAARKNNFIYIKIKNLSGKPINVLVRYGKDKVANGGAVIKNFPGDGVVYDRLFNLKDQDQWYREDNNWIGLLPQGGDIEVSFIQISRSVQ
ncbi:MAG: hypothetical protein WCL00_03420, partial [Bacteroidota bacterium]